MDSPSWVNLPSVQNTIADLISVVVEQCRAATDDLGNVSTTSQNVCFALRGVEERQRRGAQYLPNIDALYRRTAGMLDILEKVLQDHLSGDTGPVVTWHEPEQEIVKNLTSVLEIIGKTAGLVILYNETLETRSSMSPSEQMESYCKVIREASERREEWRHRCKGHTFDPEPIDTLLDSVGREAKQHLMPAGFSSPSLRIQPKSDAPPAYETVVEDSKEVEAVQSKDKNFLKGEDGEAGGSSKPGPSRNTSSQSIGPTTLNPQQIIAIPRRSRQNEKVQVFLTPESSRIVAWSVDSIELYCSGTATLLWRIGSDHNSLSKTGVPCRFRDFKCFSPDGSLAVFVIEANLSSELVVFRVNDGHVLGKKTVNADQCLSVCVSNSNRRFAISCVSEHKSDFGNVKLLAFDPNQPEGHCFTGGRLHMHQVKNDKPKPTVVSCFTPDDSHLVVSAELLNPPSNSGARTRTVHIRVFETTNETKLVKHWEASNGKVANQPPFDPEFVFPKDETTGRYKWLMAWNGDDATDPAMFKLADIAHREVHMAIKKGSQGVSFRRFLGTWIKSDVWTKVRFSSNGTWTHVVRRSKKEQARIWLTRGRWDKDGFPSTSKGETKDNPAKVLVVSADDDWQISSDGRLAVTYNKEKGRVELWSL